MQLQFPAAGKLCITNNRASPHLISHKRFLPGRPPCATVDFLVAGYRLGCIVPCTVFIPRRSIRLMQVLKAELEESNSEKAEFEEAKTGKEELEESNMQKEVEESNIRKEELEESNFKKANLFASRSERMYLPINTNSAGTTKSVSSFFSRPSGTKSILNISALQDFQYVGPNTYRSLIVKRQHPTSLPSHQNATKFAADHGEYSSLTSLDGSIRTLGRCTLPKMVFLKFEVLPVLDLRVTTTCKECIVEMLSCRIEGSKVLENQNKHFSATAKNHITWNIDCEEPFVDINVELNLVLEVYTLPFSLLPISAVERPGNVILQTLLNRLVPNFLEQLGEDYRHWVQTGTFESDGEPLFSTKPSIELDEA